MKSTLARIVVGSLAAVPLAVLFPLFANADTVSVNFENPPYTLGSINGQDGWSATGSAGSGCAKYDEGVSSSNSTPNFGSQSFRISDAVSSGCFGDQAFSKSLTDAAGEPDADTGGFPAGTIQPHFEAQFDIAAVAPGSGDVLSVSPDRGDGARMSYLRFEDQADGVHVYFDDVTDPTHVQDGDTFNEEQIAVLNSSVSHTVKFSMDFYNGPDNDVVNIYIDGTLVHTGTSWEDYYLYDHESNPGFTNNHSRIVRNLEFREGGTANPSDAGKGFLIDNFSLESGPIPAVANSCSTLTLTSNDSTIDGTETAGYTSTSLADPSAGLTQTNYSFVQNQNIGGLIDALLTQPVIPPWIDPTANATFAGSGASWVSSDSTWPGGAGNTEGSPNDDQWRLFLQGFALPAGATVTSADLWYSADNASDVYLNGNTSPLATTGFVYGAADSNNDPYYSQVFHTTFTPTAGFNELNFVVRNWSSPTLSNNTNPTGLLYKATINYCVGPVAPSTVKVTIDKFINGVMATAANANSDSFPMAASWSATNIGTGSGNYSLGPTGFNSSNPYEAVTSDMSSGASYSTSEVPDGVAVGSDCTTGATYTLAGYKTGATLAAAEAATLSTTAPSFTNLTSDEYVIVENTTCPPQTQIKVHILKYLNGAEATAASAGNYQFPMTSTWTASNLNGGVPSSGSYVLGDNYGGATDLYGADTAPMTAPASYSTAETTGGSSNVVSDPSLCAPGKFLLNGYRVSASSFSDAAAQPLTTVAPAFTGLTADEYVIVDNSTCPTTGSLTVEKNTIGGNATFSFTGDNGIGSFSLTTTGTKSGGTASETFSNLAPGTYHVTETSKSGWTQTDSECSPITVTAGEDAVCIITNTNNKQLGEIRGTKYEDEDGDGKLSDGDHHRLVGWTIYLDTNNNGKLDPGEPSDVTDSHGNYDFTGLTAGTYHVREVGQTGWVQTLPGGDGSYTVNLSAGQIAKKKNFGNFKYGSISGMKFDDANGDHKKDNGEKGLSGWTIVLHGPNHTTQTTLTDSNGNYSFTGLTAGLYTLTEVPQSGWEQTLHPSAVWISSGENEKNRNFGNKPVTKPDHHDYDNYTD